MNPFIAIFYVKIMLLAFLLTAVIYWLAKNISSLEYQRLEKRWSDDPEGFLKSQQEIDSRWAKIRNWLESKPWARPLFGEVGVFLAICPACLFIVRDAKIREYWDNYEASAPVDGKIVSVQHPPQPMEWWVFAICIILFISIAIIWGKRMGKMSFTARCRKENESELSDAELVEDKDGHFQSSSEEVVK